MKKSLSVVLVVLILSFGVFAIAKAEKKANSGIPETAGKAVHAVATPTPTAKTAELKDIINILLIGVDNASLAYINEQGNSDGLLLASINPKTREIVFTSFLRDTRVRVNGSYYDKLTNVYHTGDYELLKKVFADNFDLKIDHYALFNYLDTIELVDSVGGVEIELNMHEIYYMDTKIENLSVLAGSAYESNRISVDREGVLQLNGVQATAYMRIRPADGNYDFGRTQRARNVVAQIIKKLYAMPLPDMVSFVDTFYNRVETDIPAELMLLLGLNAEDLKSYSQHMDRIPIDDAYYNLNDGSGSYVVPDLEVNTKHLHDSIYEGIH